MHHHKTRQLGRQHALCHLLDAFNGTFPIGHLEEVPLHCDFVQCLQEYHIFKQACTSVCTGCLHHLKSSRCCQSSGAVLSGFWWFWLGSLPYHLINVDDRGFSCSRSRCTRSEQSDLRIVPLSTLLLDTDQCRFQRSWPELQKVVQCCGHSLFSFYLCSIRNVCLHWIHNK